MSQRAFQVRVREFVAGFLKLLGMHVLSPDRTCGELISAPDLGTRHSFAETERGVLIGGALGLLVEAVEVD